MKRFAIGVLCLFVFAVGAQAADNLVLATGGTAGTYYPFGGAMSKIWNTKIPGMNVTAQATGASVENVRLMNKDEVELALVLLPACPGLEVDHRALAVERGHEVFVEKGAGVGAGYPDALYTRAGARLLDTADEVFATAQMIVKVKEPTPEEYGLLQPGRLLFTYLHLAADRSLAEE